jgi:ribosomal protein S18 acetylase RimI-like enzyme
MIVATIRELGAADAAAFQALRLQALTECPTAFAASLEEEQQTALDVVAENLRGHRNRCVLGAFLDARLVGIVGVQREQPRKLAHKAFIWGMYVDPAARRHGVGHALLAEALTRAAQMAGVRQVNLGVNAANSAAVALYQRMGFTSFGLERGFMMLEGALHDELHMVCVLSHRRHAAAGSAAVGHAR